MIAAVNSGPYAGTVYAVCTSPAETNSLCVLNSDSLSESAIVPLKGAWGGPLTPYGVAVDPSFAGTLTSHYYPQYYTVNDPTGTGSDFYRSTTPYNYGHFTESISASGVVSGTDTYPASPYSDLGFYHSFGLLSQLTANPITATGTGFAINLWINPEQWTWTGSLWVDLGTTGAYALGTTTGTATVNAAYNFFITSAAAGSCLNGHTGVTVSVAQIQTWCPTATFALWFGNTGPSSWTVTSVTQAHTIPIANPGVVWVTGTDSSGPSGSGGSLCAVSMATNTEIDCWAINVLSAYNPEGLAVNANLKQVYVANNDHNTVSVFNEATSTFTSEVNVGAGPTMVAVDPSTYNVYITDNRGSTITVMTPKNPAPFTWSVTTVPTGAAPFGIVVDSATGNVWVTNSGDGTVSVLSGTTYTLLHSIKVGDTPNGIDLDTATNTAYVAMNGAGTMIPINMATFTPGTPITVGSGPFSVAFLFNPANPILPNLVFVTNNGSNTVSVINAATKTVIATIIIP